MKIGTVFGTSLGPSVACGTRLEPRPNALGILSFCGRTRTRDIGASGKAGCRCCAAWAGRLDCACLCFMVFGLPGLVLRQGFRL